VGSHRGRQRTNPSRHATPDGLLGLAVRLPRGVLATLRDADVDVDRLLARAGIEPRDLDAPLPMARIHEFLTLAFHATPPSFGLTAGSDIRPELLGISGFAAMSSATFREALGRIARYKRLLTRDRMLLVPGAGTTTLRLAVTDGASSYARQKVDAEIAFVVAFARRFTGADVQPARVAVEFPRPAYHAEYTRLFGRDVDFDQPATELVFRDVDLALPLLTSNRELSAIFLEKAEELLEATAGTAADCATRVRIALRTSLRGEAPTIGDVARQLRSSARSLQRSLRDEGTSFQAIVDEVRLELARRYLKSRHVEIAEVSYLLGFAHPSSFQRAFKRWTEMTPDAYRERALAS